MPTFYNTYQTVVSDGVVVSSTLVTIALYEPGETIDPNDGTAFRIIDDNTNDGLIGRHEFRDATGSGGIGLNGGSVGDAVLWDGTAGSSNDGDLYSSTQYAVGDDLNALIDSLPSNFPPIDPGTLSVPCFTAGTLIDTPFGPRPVETLTEGSEVLTYSPATSPAEISRSLVKVYRRHVGASALKENPNLLPVKITAGALGNGLPKRDLTVSRQHRMLVRSPIVERMFGKPEVLVSAIRLIALPGIFVDDSVQSVDYFHLLFEQHEVIFAEGAPSESFFTGPEALKSLPPDALKEVHILFPELKQEDSAPIPARMIPQGNLQHELMERHARNEMPAISQLKWH